MKKRILPGLVTIFLFSFIISLGSGAVLSHADEYSVNSTGSGYTGSQTGSAGNIQDLLNQLPQTPETNSLLQKLKTNGILNKNSQTGQNPFTSPGNNNANSQNNSAINSKTFRHHKKKRLSEIERIYMSLYPFGRPLRQFGYSYLKGMPQAATLVGAVGNGYVVGPGDSLDIYISGAPAEVLGVPNDISGLTVNREGFINIPFIGVIYVWGKNVGQITKIINDEFSARFKNVSVSVSLGSLRQFPVYVSGFVKHPGPVLVNGTETLLDALSLAGGITKEGSLRNIIIREKLSSGPAAKSKIDLYDLLLNGVPVNSYLTEGEVIYVPPIGKTVAVSGSVKRPGIYEIKNGASIKKAIALAGGMQFFSHMENVKLIKLSNGKYSTYTGNLSDKTFINQPVVNGEMIILGKIFKSVEYNVDVYGKVAYPGLYSIKNAPDLKSLISKVVLLPSTNMHYAQIVRKDSGKIIKFSPESVLKGKFDLKLETRDRVIFYPKWLIKPVEISGVGIKTPVFVNYRSGLTLLDALGNIKFTTSPNNLKAYIFQPGIKNISSRNFNASNGFGNTNNPGNFTGSGSSNSSGSSSTGSNNFAGYNNNTANGFNSYGDSNNLGLVSVVYLQNLFSDRSSKNNPVLYPGENILIKKLSPTELISYVTVLGEVERPGVYRLKNGMTLYDLLVDAGGYSSDAYPRALVLIRKSVKDLQKIQLNEAIQDVKNEIAQAVPVSGVGTASQQALLFKSMLSQEQAYLSSLKEASLHGLGRIALNMPDNLRYLKYSNSNVSLNQGDVIFVPPKPDYVLVIGAVFNQVAIPYEPGKTIQWYVDQAGGYKSNADTGNAYLIKANGRAISASQVGSFWSFMDIGTTFGELPVKPGDTIAVPPKFKAPTLWLPLAKDVTQIMFNAISTVALVKYLHY